MARLLVWIPEIKGSTMLFFFSSRDSWKLRDFSSGVEKVIMSNKDSRYSVDDILKKVKYSEKAPYVSVDKVDIWEDAIIEAYNHMLSNGKLKKETDFDENEEGIETDQLDLGRKPSERTIEIVEGQKGVSYENLFRPYVIGASSIKLVDPYIRNYHQRKNFVRFCEILLSFDERVNMELVTSAGSKDEKINLSEIFDELKINFADYKVNFSYSFGKRMHDRWIETDTGWKIHLSRGLDLYQKPDSELALGVADQTKRTCKAATITYSRKSKHR